MDIGQLGGAGIYEEEDKEKRDDIREKDFFHDRAAMKMPAQFSSDDALKTDQSIFKTYSKIGYEGRMGFSGPFVEDFFAR
jgi:hypothetical protein